MSWAAVAAIVGAVVGLVGTFSLAAWFGDPYGAMSSPPPARVAAPLGQALTVASLLGVFALVDGVSRVASRIARVCGTVLVVLFLAASAMIVAVDLGWVRFGGGAGAGGPSTAFFVLYFAKLVSPCLIPVPFALIALSGRETRVGAILLGLCVLGVPFLLAWQVFSDDVLGRVPEHVAAVVLLGGMGMGVSLLAAPLWILLGVVFLRGTRERALGRAFRAREKENLGAARRLYEEGLARGDSSVVDELVSEDFRDVRRGARGRLVMERVFAALWRSYPDLSVGIEGQEAEGDVVRTRLLLSGTDEGGVLWYPPTGRRASFAAEFVDRFSDGRLIEHSGETDTEDLIRQLGLESKDRKSAHGTPDTGD